MASFSSYSEVDSVIPSGARDLQFPGEMQIPRFARDDSSVRFLFVISPMPYHGLSNFDQHIPTLNLHRINRQLRPRRLCFSCLRVPCPPVPGANHLSPFDDSFSKGASAMQADVVHGADFAVYVGDADHLVAARKFSDFVDGWKVGLGCDFDEWHSFLRQLRTAGRSLAIVALRATPASFRMTKYIGRCSSFCRSVPHRSRKLSSRTK